MFTRDVDVVIVKQVGKIDLVMVQLVEFFALQQVVYRICHYFIWLEIMTS
jgi:hypothetical protein